MRYLNLYTIMILLLAVSACDKDKPAPVPDETTGVYISSEGGFNFGAAELSFYDPRDKQVSNGLFEAANHYKLGDVAQSVFIRDTLAFIVVNNSQKVEVVKLPSMERVRTITIANSSPRYFMAVNDSIAYVTELYAGKVYVVNYQNGNVIKKIGPVSRWTEHLLNFGNYVVVEERNLDAYPSNTCSLVRINTSTHTIESRYTFNGPNLEGIVKDGNGHIWASVNADTLAASPAKLYRINSDLNSGGMLSVPAGSRPSNLCINNTGDKLYFLDGGVMRFNITDTAYTIDNIVLGNGRNLYALGIDPYNEDIYVSDALDYIQPSRITRYDKDGNMIDAFFAGVISGNFAFRYE